MSDCDDDDEITTDCRGNKRIETICPAAAAAAAAAHRGAVGQTTPATQC